MDLPSISLKSLLGLHYGPCRLIFNTVCQKKGPLAKHENHKILKPFQGGLGMLVGPSRISGPVRPILSAVFSYFSNFTLQKNYPKCSVLTTFLHSQLEKSDLL